MDIGSMFGLPPGVSSAATGALSGAMGGGGGAPVAPSPVQTSDPIQSAANRVNNTGGGSSSGSVSIVAFPGSNLNASAPTGAVSSIPLFGALQGFLPIGILAGFAFLIWKLVR